MTGVTGGKKNEKDPKHGAAGAAGVKKTEKEPNNGKQEKNPNGGNGSKAGRKGQEKEKRVGGGVRIHLENARKSGRRGVQYVAQCVACAALMLDIWQ